MSPLLELQSKYNRVGVETPFGLQRYDRNPDGSYNMVTDIGDEGKGLVSRAVSLGMTDSNRQQAPAQLNAIAGALASRMGQRMGLDIGNQPVQLTQTPAQTPAKPQQQQQLPPPQQGLPPSTDLPPSSGLP